MAEQDDLAIFLDDFSDGGNEAFDAGGIGDLAISNRDIEVRPQKHALPRQIEFIQGLEAVAHRAASGSGLVGPWVAEWHDWRKR
ncbi:hypothetical protein D3C87_1746360 [compost metagenome]